MNIDTPEISTKKKLKKKIEKLEHKGKKNRCQIQDKQE
jgi:hypothetical protein